MQQTTTKELPVWRSLLYVPVNVEKYVEKAHTRGADCIILDLEDSIPPAEKARARTLVQDAAARVSRSSGADVMVRINRPIEQAVRDIEAVVSDRVQAIAVTKCEGVDHVRLLAELVDTLEAERGIPVGTTRFSVMVETADAFFRMQQIAAAHPRVAALTLGGEDFAMSVGMYPDPETMLYPKQQAIIAARAAGVLPLGIIGTVADFQDHEAVRQMIAKSRKFGFVGGSCIHPAIVPLLNEGFSPPEEDVKNAQRLCAEFDKAVAEGRGSLTVDGKMVDIPVVIRARELLQRAEAIRARTARMAASGSTQ